MMTVMAIFLSIVVFGSTLFVVVAVVGGVVVSLTRSVGAAIFTTNGVLTLTPVSVLILPGTPAFVFPI